MANLTENQVFNLVSGSATTGQSTYDMWKSIKGNEDKSVRDFLNYLKDDGESNVSEETLAQIEQNKNDISQLQEEIADLDISKVEQSDLEAEVENQLDGAKADIVTQVLAQIGGMPVFGTVDDNNKITLTSMLADGDYVMVYENDEGTLETICEFTVGNGESDEPTVNEYEVTITANDYTDGSRWSTTDGTIRSNAPGYTAINKIPLNRVSGQTATITLSGITWTDDALATQYAYILMFVGESFTSGHNVPFKGLPKNYDDLGVSAVLNADGTITITVVDGTNGLLYDGFKLCGVGSGANAKITIRIG